MCRRCLVITWQLSLTLNHNPVSLVKDYQKTFCLSPINDTQTCGAQKTPEHTSVVNKACWDRMQCLSCWLIIHTSPSQVLKALTKEKTK